MILHEYKGWAITQSGREVHLCHPLGGTMVMAKYVKEHNPGPIFICPDCQTECPEDVLKHLERVRLFAL